MKKFLATALLSLVIAFTGSSLAQDLSTYDNDASHQLEITIPSVVLIRISSATANPVVIFNPSAAQYLSAVDGGTALPASATSDLTGIEVWASEPWLVSATATPILDTNDDVATGLSLSDIGVSPSGAAAGVTVTDFTLDAGVDFASGVASGGSWLSLGIDADSYTLVVTGDEEAGDYSTTVTYTIVAGL